MQSSSTYTQSVRLSYLSRSSKTTECRQVCSRRYRKRSGGGLLRLCPRIQLSWWTSCQLLELRSLCHGKGSSTWTSILWRSPPTRRLGSNPKLWQKTGAPCQLGWIITFSSFRQAEMKSYLQKNSLLSNLVFQRALEFSSLWPTTNSLLCLAHNVQLGRSKKGL